MYGGCEAGSSSNKFKTKALCQKTCLKPQGSLVQEVVQGGPPKNLELSKEQNNEKSNKSSNICAEEGGKRGLCNGALEFWYFKQDTQTCESFIYGGCEAGSSKNKFETRELCVQTCNLFWNLILIWVVPFLRERKRYLLIFIVKEIHFLCVIIFCFENHM